MKYKTKVKIVEAFQVGVDSEPEWFIQAKKEKGLIAFDNYYVVKDKNDFIEVLTEDDFYKKYELTTED